MSSNKRVVWSEGLFLRSQHFQQHERYLERYTELRAGTLRSNSWGFAELEIELEQLGFGKLALRRARGVFPDGTPFCMPDDDPLPAAIDIAPNVRDKTAFLALPVRKAGAVDYVRRNSDAYARYIRSEFEARDSANDNAAPARIEVGELACRILLEGEPVADFACIPLAQVLERGADLRVKLDKYFIPSVMRIEPATVLAQFLTELEGLLHQRGEELASRATSAGRGVDTAEYLFLQLCNRYEPLVGHWATSFNLHPEDFYAFLLSLAGELATFTSEVTRRPQPLPAYEHDRLRRSYEPVIAAVRGAFAAIVDRKAERIELKSRLELGVWQGVIADKTLIDNASFVLAVTANVPAEQIRRYFPAQAKAAAVEHLKRYVVDQVPGIPLTPLPQPPRQMPYYKGYVYFELDTQSPRWKELRTSGAIAFHVAGQYPGIMLELWAIRG
jgi:type VI secretion system protein ImpJ